MRVRFLRAYGEYLQGAVVDLDEGVAAGLLDLNVIKEYPRTQVELAEAATKYYPGDEGRSDRQKAERTAQLAPPPAAPEAPAAPKEKATPAAPQRVERGRQ